MIAPLVQITNAINIIAIVGSAALLKARISSEDNAIPIFLPLLFDAGDKDKRETYWKKKMVAITTRPLAIIINAAFCCTALSLLSRRLSS
jgi:hypothetical protein